VAPVSSFFGGSREFLHSTVIIVGRSMTRFDGEYKRAIADQIAWAALLFPLRRDRLRVRAAARARKLIE